MKTPICCKKTMELKAVCMNKIDEGFYNEWSYFQCKNCGYVERIKE